MTASRAWVEANLGFNPQKVATPVESYSVKAAAKKRPANEDLAREIVDFDSEGPEGQAFLAFTTATGLSRFVDIPWPGGLAPKPDKTARRGKGGALPPADVLVVTWTVDEGHALSRVLTPGKDSKNNYIPYRHNYAAIAKKMTPRCPARQAGRLGAYWTARIKSKRVVVFKSESHLSQDTKKMPSGSGTLPNEDVWRQIIQEVNPKLVITTGTGGGIGKSCEVGDVVVSPIVRFDCQKWLKRAPYHAAIYRDAMPQTRYVSRTNSLFKANGGQLPKTNTRPPRIILARSNPSSVVTTDFFGFDTSKNYYHLQGLGALSEMGDAVLGRVAQSLGTKAPDWVAVRNVSDPQIKSEGTIHDQGHLAKDIYKGYGRWSSVCSAIVCWALVAGI